MDLSLVLFQLKLLRLVDTDQDGKVSFSEYTGAFQLMDSGAPDDLVVQDSTAHLD